MNEQLRNLMLEAGYAAPELASRANKLAELLVRECLTQCDKTRADYFKHRKAADDFTDKNVYAEGEAASDIIKYKIKKHFGIE